MVHAFIKTFNNKCFPSIATSGSAGYDLYANEDVTLRPNKVYKVPLGFAIELDHGFEARISGRSGLASRGVMCHVGVVDSDYRGEVCALMYYISDIDDAYTIFAGDRVAQMVIGKVYMPDIIQVAELSKTDRTGGFGSTGK